MNDMPNFALPHIHKVGHDKYEAQHGTDAELIVTFEMEAVPQPYKSEQEGRPIFEDQPYIRIEFPGDRTRRLYRPVKLKGDQLSPSDPDRFPRQWAAFQAQQAPVQHGTPLKEWPMIGKAQVFELRAANVHTVEQLAAVHDGTLHTLGMGGRELRDKAKAWLERAKEGAGLSAVMARLEALEAENALLKSRKTEAELDPLTGEVAEDRKSRARKAA